MAFPPGVASSIICRRGDPEEASILGPLPTPLKEPRLLMRQLQLFLGKQLARF